MVAGHSATANADIPGANALVPENVGYLPYRERAVVDPQDLPAGHHPFADPAYRNDEFSLGLGEHVTHSGYVPPEPEEPAPPRAMGSAHARVGEPDYDAIRNSEAYQSWNARHSHG